MTNTKRKPFTAAEAKIIGNKLGMNWEQFDLTQFRLGLNAELADGAYNPMTDFASEDPILIGKIVRTHLNENPAYYTEWAQMEKDANHNYSDKRSGSQAETMTVAE